MSKPLLKLAARSKPGPSYALIRKACRMFKGSYGPRDERHRNIRAWIVAREKLGDKSREKLGDKSLLATPVQRIT